MQPFSYTLAQHLELTYLEYEALRQYYFEKWCKLIVRSQRLKCFITNDHLLNWYAEQWYIQQYYPSILLKKITVRAARSEHQANTKRTPSEHQANTKRRHPH